MPARGVAIEYVGERRWASLRSTLPPKPGSGRARSYSQRIATGVSAETKEGRRRIKALKARLEEQLFSGSFRWSDWGVGESPRDEQPIAELLAGLHRHKQATRPVEPRTWRTGYELPLRQLLSPLDRPLTEEAILEALSQSKVASSTRKRDLTALRALADFAGLNVDFTSYRHRYNRGMVRARELPSDEEIHRFIASLDRSDLRWACGILCCYGLRPSELSDLDLSDYPKVRVHQDRKTGGRAVLPLPQEWAQEWALGVAPFTAWNMGNPQLIAHNMRHHMRDRGWRWQVYDLRHAFARRCASRGVSPSVAARLMGHSVEEHTTAYHAFIGEESWLEMFSRQSGQAPTPSTQTSSAPHPPQRRSSDPDKTPTWPPTSPES